jgi:Uma2 family endonuclease
MSTATELMTVEDFRLLPDPADGSRYELHAGRLVSMPPPKNRHIYLQIHIRKLLEREAGERAVVHTEWPFRATPEHEFRYADVALVKRLRFERDNLDDNLHGAPELVVEVVSPSNTEEELDEKEALCLANGCREFWVVYPKGRYVRVATGDTTRRYREGDQIPLLLFPGQTIAVSEIFSILPSSSQG